MGLALIPQAGVAIGLAFLGQRILPEETGKLLLTIILSSSVLYEMAGPVCAKLALILSGSIPGDKPAFLGQGESGGQDEPASVEDMESREKDKGKAAESFEKSEGLEEKEGMEGSCGNPDRTIAECLEELESGVENQEYFDIEQEHGLTEENIADAGKEKKSKNCKKEKQVKKKRKKH